MQPTPTRSPTACLVTAEPGSPSADGLRLLASWDATAEQSYEHSETAVPDESTVPDGGTAQGGTAAVGLHRGHIRRPDRGHQA